MANPALEAKIDAVLRDHFKAQHDFLSKGVTQWIATTKSWNDLRQSPHLAQYFMGMDPTPPEESTIVDAVVTDLVNRHYKPEPLVAQRDRISFERSPKQDVSIRAPLEGNVGLLSAVSDVKVAPFDLDFENNHAVFKIGGPFSLDEKSVAIVTKQVDDGYAIVKGYLDEINLAATERRDAAVKAERNKIQQHVKLLMTAPDIDGVMAFLQIKKFKD